MMKSLSIVMVLALMGCGEKKVETKPSNQIDPRAEFRVGVTAMKAGDYAKAQSSFEHAVGIGLTPIIDPVTQLPKDPEGADPGYAKAWYNAGYAAARAGNDAESVKYYRKALTLEPGMTGAIYGLGGALIGAGKAAEAVAEYRKYVEARPEDLDARNNLTDALTAAKMYDEAVKEAQEVLARDPKNVGAYRNLSRSYFAQGNYTMSLLCAEKAKSINDGDAGIYNNIGVIYLAQNEEAAAIAEFKEAIKLDAKNREANLNLGTMALRSGDYALALTCFKAAVDASPGDVGARMGLAIALRGTKDYDASAKIYDELLSKNATDSVIVFNAVTLQEKYKKDFKKAVKILESYQATMAGKLSKVEADDLAARLVAVRASEEAERQRQEEIARKKKEEAERKARAEKILIDLATSVSQLEKDITDPCIAGNAEIVEMANMTLEQVRPVVALKDSQDADERQSAIDAAPDLQTFIDGVKAQIEEMKAACAGAAPTPAPEGAAPAAPATDGAAPAAPTPG